MCEPFSRKLSATLAGKWTVPIHTSCEAVRHGTIWEGFFVCFFFFVSWWWFWRSVLSGQSVLEKPHMQEIENIFFVRGSLSHCKGTGHKDPRDLFFFEDLHLPLLFGNQKSLELFPGVSGKRPAIHLLKLLVRSANTRCQLPSHICPQCSAKVRK